MVNLNTASYEDSVSSLQETLVILPVQGRQSNSLLAPVRLLYVPAGQRCSVAC